MDDRQFTQRALDCQRKLYRVALSMLRCDADAADAIQEAVFKGWLHRGALRDGERFEAWLTRILVNECRNIQRRWKRRGEPLDEARAAAEYAAADQRAAEQARDKMAEDMRLLNASLASAQDAREQAERDAARLEKDLAELKARPVEVAVETVVDQAAINKARADAIAEMQEKLDKARAAADKARDKQKQAEASVEILKRSLEERDKSEKKAAIAGDKELAQFEVLFVQGQELAHKMQGYLLKARGREDQTAAQGMEKAMKSLADTIGRCAE